MSMATPQKDPQKPVQRTVRRSRNSKEEKKISPEERLMQRWEQQVFFLKKMFPNSEKDILAVRRRYEAKVGKEKVFQPTDDAVMALIELYAILKQNAPRPPMSC
jgi:hypothetical protein